MTTSHAQSGTQDFKTQRGKMPYADVVHAAGLRPTSTRTDPGTGGRENQGSTTGARMRARTSRAPGYTSSSPLGAMPI